ncbi:Heavy-metal-associated domain, partial [Musa troglodytarum]
MCEDGAAVPQWLTRHREIRAEEVVADSRTHREEGRGGSDEVAERVQKKNGRKVELFSPLPPPPQPEKKEQEKRKSTCTATPSPRDQEKASEDESMKGGIFLVETGVQTAEPDLKSSEVTVKGAFFSASPVANVHKRTEKKAAVAKQETEEKTKAEHGHRRCLVGVQQASHPVRGPKDQNTNDVLEISMDEVISISVSQKKPRQLLLTTRAAIHVSALESKCDNNNSCTNKHPSLS